MAYGGYADKINSCKSELDTLASAIKAIDFSSSWSGPAFDKQNSNIELVLNGLNEQCGYLSNLANALSLIDEYDKKKSVEESYQSRINNLNTESSTYASDLSSYKRALSSVREERMNLRNQILDYLNSISNRYNDSLTDIVATEVVNTVNAFAKVDSISSTITEAFDMTKTVVSANALSEDKMKPNFNNREAWVTNNPYSSVGLYGQCTWFAWGRFYEMYGFSPGFTGNGNQCASQLLRAHSDKFYKSSTPVAGAVFSQGLGEKYGHVGIVLEVDVENDKIVIQDGNYNGKTDSFAVAQSDWGTKEMSLKEFCAKRGGAVFACPKEGVL